MEATNKKVILVALIMAIFTALLIYFYIKNTTTKSETVESINVYVAAKTLPSKHKITEMDLKQEKVAKEYLNAKAVLKKADIIGKRLKESVIEGEQILEDRLASGDNNPSLSYIISRGSRAVSINVDEQIEVANLIRPGDFVDVIASFDKEDYEDGTIRIVYPRTTKIIIQNVKVLALGQEQFIEEGKKAGLPKTVTLAIGSQDMERLVYASEFGTLRLALRSPDDDDIVNTQGVVRGDTVKGR